MKELYLERTPYEDFEQLDEAIWSSFTKSFGKSFKNASKSGGKGYDKFASVIGNAITKGQDFANYVQKKYNVSPALAIALTAAGLTGGLSAIPMGAIMYFTRKHINKALTAGVSSVVDTAFDVAQGINQKSNTPQKYDMNMGELSKSSATKYKENLSFKEWLELDEGWMDWLASKTGKVLGAGAGYIYGFGKNLLQGLGNRIKEIYSYITKNPREATKMAAIVGTAMLTGGVVGKISHDVVNAVSNKISGIIHGVNPTEVHQTVSQISPDGSGDFKGGTSSSGDLAALLI